jgi:FlaA1/EpsC-like NDP-sugar epimerase
MLHVNPPYAEASINAVPCSCPIRDSVIAKTLYFKRMVPCAGYDFSAPILQCRACDTVNAGTALALRDLTSCYANLAGVCNCGGALVYGAGNHTFRLMAQSTALTNCDVPAVFDRNRHLHGTRIGNSPVFSPENLGEFPGLSIIILTFYSRHEIRTALQAEQSRVIVSLCD